MVFERKKVKGSWIILWSLQVILNFQTNCNTDSLCFFLVNKVMPFESFASLLDEFRIQIMWNLNCTIIFAVEFVYKLFAMKENARFPCKRCCNKSFRLHKNLLMRKLSEWLLIFYDFIWTSSFCTGMNQIYQWSYWIGSYYYMAYSVMQMMVAVSCD